MNMHAKQTASSDDYPTRLTAEEWSERKDPVVWSKWTPEAPLTQEQTQSYADNGYLVLKNLFTKAEVAALQAVSAALRSGQVPVDTEDKITEPGSDAIRTVFRLDRHNALFDRLAR